METTTAEPHDVSDAINQACHGFTFDDLGAQEIETGPTVTQNGVTYFDLDLGHLGQFWVVVKSKTNSPEDAP